MSIKDDDLQNGAFLNEIELYSRLKGQIKHTINEFEKNNCQIDSNKKSFILSLIAMPTFRKKVEYVLEKYNMFAKNYSKYPEFTDTELTEFSQQLSLARNSIHGEHYSHLDIEKAEYATRLTVLGLYIYILEESGASPACVFNLIQCMFS